MTDGDARDIVEIQQLIYRYGWAIDHREFDSLDDIFTEDAVIHYDVEGGTKKPFQEMKTWLPGGLSQFRLTQHNMSNPMVEIDGDRASSRTYGHLIHVQEVLAGGTSVMRHHAIYTDAWVRTPAGWRIEHRTLSNLYMDGPVLPVDEVKHYTKPLPF